MVAVGQEEIVEIPAHLFGRRHGGEKIKLRPVRERREFIRQHVCLNLPGHDQFLLNPLLFFLPVFLFCLLPLHPPDCVHLLRQGVARPVNLPLHLFKLVDGERPEFNGLQVSLPHADNLVLQGVELAHELFQPQRVEDQRDQEHQPRGDPDSAADTVDHLLVVLHVHFPHQRPFG